MTSEDIGQAPQNKPHVLRILPCYMWVRRVEAGPNYYYRVIIEYIETRLWRGTPGHSLSLEEGAGNRRGWWGGGGGGKGKGRAGGQGVLEIIGRLPFSPQF